MLAGRWPVLIFAAVAVVVPVLIGAVLLSQPRANPPTADWLIVHALTPASPREPDGSITLSDVEFEGVTWDCVLTPEPVSPEQPFGFTSRCDQSG
jgi:hypothetical protein